MAVSNLIVTNNYTTQSNLTFEPSDYYVQGLSTEGSVTFRASSNYSYPLTLILRDAAGNYVESGRVQIGETAALKSIFPGIDIEGKYLSSDFVTFQSVQIVNPTSHVGAPTAVALASTISRNAVELSWGAGSAGTGNSVTGYDVQYRESSNGSSWGGWQAASGSPVTGTRLNVFPSEAVGNYRQYRVRTRGSAGESWYSGWVESTNTLRRKWAPFGTWTDAILTAGVSGIRAVHLTQLQERVSVIRAFYGLAAYGFTVIEARKTKIAKWAALISEIRSAIDGITTSHEAWNTLQAGRPRIAHIMQLRKIIDGMSGESETGVPFVFNIDVYGNLLCSSNSNDVPPFYIDGNGHLIYSHAADEAYDLSINASGHLIMTTEG